MHPFRRPVQSASVCLLLPPSFTILLIHCAVCKITIIIIIIIIIIYNLYNYNYYNYFIIIIHHLELTTCVGLAPIIIFFTISASL